jgi:hypothetical protein
LGVFNPQPTIKRNKKTDAANHSQVIIHVGLLVNEPTGQAGLLFI